LLRDRQGGESLLPLRSGAVHYWRLSRSAWRPALQSLLAMELPIVETYVPWQVHERPIDEGSDETPQLSFEGRLDVAAFLREAHALGLKAIIRPGPHINAELTDFGLPERVVWNREFQARSPRQNPVLLPAPPRAFPVPSYASRAFLGETAKWLGAVAEQLRELQWPDGPIVLVQIDNEGSMYFRDGIYDQDYHPDAVAHWRGLLRAKYREPSELARAYGLPIASFDDAAPPTRYDVRSAEDLPRHVDWAVAHESLLAEAFHAMADVTEAHGFARVPLFHNMPMGESATPLHPALLRGSQLAPGRRGLDFVSLDYYHTAGDVKSIVRRTTELVSSCEGLGHPAFAAEMGAGAPPFFPPLDERDAIFTLLCAMAYGVRGYNVYMAVERDRWLGSPVDASGTLRPFASFFRKVGAAWDRVAFHTLRRRAPGRLVVPRGMRRLARVMHAFGPVSQALFRVMGAGMLETVLEDAIDFGEGHLEAPPIRAGRILVAAERAMDEEGIPFAFADGGDADVALEGAELIAVPTSCGIDGVLVDALRRAQARGAHAFWAPGPPSRDATFAPLSPRASKSLVTLPSVVGDDALDVTAMRRHLREAMNGRSIRKVIAGPAPCAATVHEDDAGTPRVMFVVNPTKSRARVMVRVGEVRRVRDLLDGSEHALEAGVQVDAGTVRFCEIIE
jgi:beta-galactosidase